MIAQQARSTSLHSGDVFDGEGAHLAVALLVPECDRWTEYVDGGHLARLDDVVSGSWASVEFTGDPAPYRVQQGGHRRLWDEVEAAYTWWRDAGSPSYDRFGLTVDPSRQWVWLDEPGNIIWSKRGAYS